MLTKEKQMRAMALEAVKRDIRKQIIRLTQEKFDNKIKIKSFVKRIEEAKKVKPLFPYTVTDAAGFKREYKFTQKQIELVERLTGKTIEKAIVDDKPYINVGMLKLQLRIMVENQTICKRKIGILQKTLTALDGHPLALYKLIKKNTK